MQSNTHHPMNLYPPALAHFDGAPVKTDKSSLRKYMEENIPCPDVAPEMVSAWIFDGMAIIQQLKDIPGTFEKLANKVLHQILSTGKQHGANVWTS